MNALTKTQLEKAAPAIFADGPVKTASEKYVFIPTWEIVKNLEKLNWFPVKANQINTKNSDYVDKNFHTIRFRTKDNLDLSNMRGEVIPELLLSTSHLTRHAYKMNMGLHKILCENGLTVQEIELASLRIVHSGMMFEEVKEVVISYMKQLPNALTRISVYKKIILSSQQKYYFAKKALEIKYHNYGDSSTIENISDYLIPRRDEDKKDDLWTVFNVVQENLIKGGVKTIRDGKERSSRQLTNIHREDLVNKGLWMLMASYVK